MKNGIMIDIETLGTAVDSVILSIGAVEFNKEGEILQEFETKIDIDSCLEHGRTISGDTVRWWLRQDEAARKELWTGEMLNMPDALLALAEVFIWDKKPVWANGIVFDIGILNSAYKAFGCHTPWKFWDVRDYRTIKGLIPKDVFRRVRESPKVAHSALADARAQAITLARMMRWLRGEE